MSVYLLHFEEPIGDKSNPRSQARHYLGYARKGRLADRLEEHAAGVGARIMAAVMDANVQWECVRVWMRGSRQLERQLKNKKRAWKLCPYCKATHSLAGTKG